MHNGCRRDRLIKTVCTKKHGSEAWLVQFREHIQHMFRKENAMAKEPEVNDNTPQDQERQPRQQSGDKRNEQNVQGNALQMNDNSAGGKEPARSPALPRRGSGDKSNQQKLRSKALQVNENSLEDHGPAQEP
jgi:hypothetical protein